MASLSEILPFSEKEESHFREHGKMHLETVWATTHVLGRGSVDRKLSQESVPDKQSQRNVPI